MSGGISASVAIAAVGAAASVASSVNNIVSSGGGPSSGPVSQQTGGSGSGGGGGLSVQQTQYAYYGPHQSTQPLSNGEQAPKPTPMTAQKPVQAQAASARNTPTQGSQQNAASANADYKNYWADHLQKYLDYNTRGLG